jgi:tRNA-dihydrouridine synthase A
MDVNDNVNNSVHQHLLSVAPMMDWTDRHCRYFHRLITRETLLYTEMVTTGALLFGDQARHLDFDACEHPVALQLGGSEPQDLASSAKLGERWGYDEINLNCGCPSERVQRGAFGACLMNEPQTVADGVKAIKDVVGIPVTVKHRIGIDHNESYSFVRDFVGEVSLAGCEVFIVHARNAILKGLSPKENREIPPLRYGVVHQLRKDFPQLRFILNGGIQSNDQIALEGPLVHGVMVGRAAYHTPMMMRSWDQAWASNDLSILGRDRVANLGTQGDEEEAFRLAIEEQMVLYMEKKCKSLDVSWLSMARHMLGLWHAQPGARLWRQVWSDSRLKDWAPLDVMQKATSARRSAKKEPKESVEA